MRKTFFCLEQRTTTKKTSFKVNIYNYEKLNVNLIEKDYISQ